MFNAKSSSKVGIRVGEEKPWWRLDAETWLIICFLLPTMLFLVFLIWYPFLHGVWMSFHYWPFIGEPKWMGLEVRYCRRAHDSPGPEILGEGYQPLEGRRSVVCHQAPHDRPLSICLSRKRRRNCAHVRRVRRKRS